MSLFASAFDTATHAGPSRPSSSSTNKPAKRKRPSSGSGEKDGQIRSTQVNLEKLMSRVERGDVKEKKGDGRDAMGLNGKKKPRKMEEDGDAAPKYQEKRKDTAGKIKPPQKGNKLKMSHMGGTKLPGRDESHKQEKIPLKPLASKSPSFNKPAPAEIPLPHPIPHTTQDISTDLTPLQKNMQSKLEAARFRWINEQLYSTKSGEAVEMMRKDPKIFADYHMTHRVLTSAWPQPPLPHLVSLLTPLPSSTVIADLGCGDAGLAKALVPQGKVVLSYDLVGDSGVPGTASSGWVVEADFLEGVPLPGRPGGTEATELKVEPVSKKKKGKQGEESRASEVVDVVVCCLSLMGVNWVGGIYESCRILKQGGTLHIAEVTSRFISTEAFVEKVESFGFAVQNQESPSTHFTLFEFTKTSSVPLGPARGQVGWAERVVEGEQILRGCVYKKR